MSETLAAVRAMETSAERLGKQLKSLDEVKPGVVMIQPVASVLRHTALWPPAPHPLAGGAPLGPSAPVPRCLEPVELVVQLEGSGEACHPLPAAWFVCPPAPFGRAHWKERFAIVMVRGA